MQNRATFPLLLERTRYTMCMICEDLKKSHKMTALHAPEGDYAGIAISVLHTIAQRFESNRVKVCL